MTWPTGTPGTSVLALDEASPLGCRPYTPGMIGPGVNMERPRHPVARERSGIIHITLIGLALATVIAGGVHLLGRTQLAWNARYGERPPTPKAQPQSEAPLVLPAPDPVYEQLKKDFAAGRLRCVNGQLFRKLPNGWENIPGEDCLQEDQPRIDK